MKNKFITIRVLFSLFITFIISCSDDDLTKEEGGIPPSKEFLTGGKRATEEEWGEIKFITDADIDNLISLRNENTRSFVVIPDNLPPTIDQVCGSCTATSVAFGISYMMNGFTGMEYINRKLYDNDLFGNDASPRVFSSAFLHNKASGICDRNGRTGGASIPRVLKKLSEFGIPTEADWTMTTENMEINIPGDVYDKALFYNKRGTESWRVHDLDKIKRLVFKGYPVYFSMYMPIDVNGSYLRRGKGIYGVTEINEDYDFSTPNLKLGYHTMTIVGYSEITNAFLVQNSSGEEFGGDTSPKGSFWLSFDILNKKIPNSNILYITDFGVVNFVDGRGGMEGKKIQSKLYEFTGFSNYKDVNYSRNFTQMIDVTNNVATIKLDQGDYIKYPSTSVIPNTGTIEMEFKIDKFTHELTDSKTGKFPTDSKEMIDSVWTDDDLKGFRSWDDRQNSTVLFSTYIKGWFNSADGFSLRVNKKGEVILEFGIKDYIDPTDEELKDPKIQETTQEYSLLGSCLDVKGSCPDVKDGWNKVALSIDNQGNIITIVNGRGYLIANYNYKKFETEQKKFTIGESHTEVRYFYYKIYERIEKPNGTIEKKLLNIKRYKYNLIEGFTGNIKSFRTSDISEDWVITKGTNSKVYKRIN